MELGKNKLNYYTIQAYRTFYVQDKVKIKQFSNLLNNIQLLPLMYMKNLHLVFQLERPEFVYLLNSAATKVDYIIKNIKYNACLIQPSDEVLEMYRMAYNSTNPQEMSIDIPYVSYQHNMKFQQSPNGILSYTIPASCRSARNILTAFYTPYNETISTLTNFTLNVDSIAKELKMDVLVISIV